MSSLADALMGITPILLDGTRSRVHRLRGPDDERRERVADLKSAVLVALELRPLALGALAHAVDREVTNVRDACYALLDEGKIQRVGQKYSLSVPEPAITPFVVVTDKDELLVSVSTESRRADYRRRGNRR